MHYLRSLLWKKGWNFLVFTNLQTQFFKSNFIRTWSNYWIEYDDTNFEFRNLPAQKSLYKKDCKFRRIFYVWVRCHFIWLPWNVRQLYQRTCCYERTIIDIIQNTLNDLLELYSISTSISTYKNWLKKLGSQRWRRD